MDFLSVLKYWADRNVDHRKRESDPIHHRSPVMGTGLPQPEERDQEEVWPGLWPNQIDTVGTFFSKGHGMTGMTMEHMESFTYSTKAWEPIHLFCSSILCCQLVNIYSEDICRVLQICFGFILHDSRWFGFMLQMMPSITAHCQDACNVGDEGGCTLGGVSTTATMEWPSVLILWILTSFIKQNRFTMINWSIYLICQENIGFGNKTKYPETRWNADAEDLHQASKTTTRPSPTWIQAIWRYVFGTFLNGLCQPWVRNTCPVWSVGYLLWPCFIFE